MSSHAADPDESVARLLASLDSDDLQEAEEARYELETHGARVVGPLITAVPGFGRLGQLLAIEIFSTIGDMRAGATIIPMLRNDGGTVRGSAARCWRESSMTSSDIDRDDGARDRGAHGQQMKAENG